MRKLSILLACVLVFGLLLSTVPVSAATENYFPEDLFSSADVCGQYFTNVTEPGTIFEEVDGEYVMTMPLHAGLNYLYTKEAIPYDSFTVSFDFYIIISPNSHFHEMDFLFGMTGGPKPFHQVTLTSESGSLNMRHYKLEEEWYQYEEDALFYDVYDEEYWQTFTVEITPEEVSIYLNDEYLATLTDTAGCVGANGYIGLRAGSAGGWKIKNLQLVEGVDGGAAAEPTEEPTEAPEVNTTEDPTQEPVPEVSATPVADDESTPGEDEPQANAPTSTPAAEETSDFPWLIVGIVAAVVVLGGVVVLLLVLKKKNNR